MVDEARSLGANTIGSARFQTSIVIAGAAELLAFGTAVVVKND